MVTDQMLEHVVEKLSDRVFSQGRWHNPYAEIQEDGQYLLVEVAVPESTVDMSAKNDIATLLVATIPLGGEATIGNWMVVFKKDDKVIDSWAPYDP